VDKKRGRSTWRLTYLLKTAQNRLFLRPFDPHSARQAGRLPVPKESAVRTG
jgi:hypothetical protein